jgi:predicted ribosome quality control (RQC) complex YloA/Tae2 family protein
MPLDGVSARFLSAELNLVVADARVDRIYQPERHDILLILRCGNQNRRLLLSANPAAPRMHLTDEDRENPGSPPMFCMLLRKHLLGARLIDLTSPGFERLFILRFQTINDLGDPIEKRLIIEIMGRHSNIILLNEDGRIHDAIQHVDESISRVREIMPARPYQLPPQQDKRDPLSLRDDLRQDRPWLSPALAVRPLAGALLASIQGFSPQLCQEVVCRAGIDERLHAGQLDEAGHRQLNQILLSLLDSIARNQYAPTTFHDQPDSLIPLDFHALPLQIYAIRRPAASLSLAMDLFYSERGRQNTLKQKKQVLEREVQNQLDHVIRKLRIHEEDAQAGDTCDQHKRQGELILANLANWQEGSGLIEAVDYYDPDQTVIKIPIDPGLTAAQMAQRCFRRYNRARTRGENGRRLAAEDRAEIEWLESLLHELEQAADLADLPDVRREMEQGGLTGERRQRKNLENPVASFDQHPGKAGSRSRRHRNSLSGKTQPKKKKNTSKTHQEQALPPRRHTSSDGLAILVGRNNLQNDALTLRTAAKDDLWLHVQKMPGSHVIVRAERRPVPDRTIEEAAAIAAWYSRATSAVSKTGDAGLQKVAVDYCPVSHVRKPSGAKPGMVIYDRYQTILVSPGLPENS